MSSISITPYFLFCRVIIYEQTVTKDESIIYARPDKRFKPICSVCNSSCDSVHEWKKRPIRDLHFGSAKVSIECSYRKVFCEKCGSTIVENMEFFEPYRRVTRRLAKFIHDLCKILTVQDVARHLNLDWKTVKDIDKTFLEEEFGETDYTDLTVLAVDEISIRRGHSYMTVVLDYLTGRVVWMGIARRADTLIKFFDGMTKEQKEHLDRLLELNETISKAMILKDKLKLIWKCESRKEAKRQIDEWCALAKTVHNRSVDKFVKRILRYEYGILNHCDYPINTSIL